MKLIQLLLTARRIQLSSTLVGEGEELVAIKDRPALSGPFGKQVIETPNSPGEDLSSQRAALLSCYSSTARGASARVRGHLVQPASLAGTHPPDTSPG